MTNWIETYRGAVPPWQCDVTEHFTIAYYFDRLEEAEATLCDELGLPGLTRRPDVPRAIIARFAKELRAGASFHLESAALGTEGGLRLGHRVVDSASGEVVTWFDQTLDLAAAPLDDARRSAINARLGEWNGPAPEARTDPPSTRGFVASAGGRVKTADVDAGGHFALGAIVHRFSNASGQFGAAIGMNAAYMQSERRGFSTFELTLRLSGVLRLDQAYQVRTGIALFGNSSLRMLHVMTDARTGAEVARMGQYGVNLDLDARRPARWPDEIRARAQALAAG